MSEEKAHAELSASGSERWLRCSGSVRLNRDAPELPESPYAVEGTIAHGYLEEWLKRLRDGGDYKVPKLLKANKDMLKAVYKAVDFIDGHWNAESEELLIEQRLSLEYLGPDMFGTGDILIVEIGEHLQVWDYKHGKGHPVNLITHGEYSATHNTQLIYYALAAAHRFKFDFKKVTIGILQPRADHPDGWKRSVTLTMKELRSYEELFLKGIARVKSGGRLETGPWCHWCKSKNYNCPKQEQLKYEKVDKMFDDL